jgi:hypothetical protein
VAGYTEAHACAWHVAQPVDGDGERTLHLDGRPPDHTEFSENLADWYAGHGQGHDSASAKKRRWDLYFVHGQENCAKDMGSAPNICNVKYEEGYVTFGMPERYTMRMLFAEIHDAHYYII